MADMIKEVFLAFSSDNTYNKYTSEISEDSIAFILKKGEEKLITQNHKFFFIPGDGSVGQILKKRDGYFSWDDLYSVRINNRADNLSTENAIQVLTLSNSNEGQKSPIKFTNSFSKGQNCTLYMTMSEESSYPVVVTIDASYISLGGGYEVPLTPGEWKSVSFFSTGGYVYFSIDDYGKELSLISDKVDGAYMLLNGHDVNGNEISDSVTTNSTNIVKNEYEFSVGAYNSSTRETSTKFGVKNSIFTVGNGTQTQRHDAFRVLQNGELEIVDTHNGSGSTYSDRGTMILQDKLEEYENEISDLKSELSAANDTIAVLTSRLDALEGRVNECCPPSEDEEVDNGDELD